MGSNFKPMLAHNVDDLSKVNFPVIASPKLDGVRAITIDGVVKTRSMKLLPNRHIQKKLRRFQNLDGELIVGSPSGEGVFNRTTSVVMSHDKEAEWFFAVFDYIGNLSYDFEKRRKCVEDYTSRVGMPLRMVPQLFARDANELRIYDEVFVEKGYEGTMIRDPKSFYKCGRSTMRSGILGKIKSFHDTEGRVVAVEELMHNMNEQVINELGRSSRSTHKENMVPSGTLGALVIESPQWSEQFKIGTGFTEDQRKELWENPDLIGSTVKFKYQPHGVKDRPRFPVFIGLRGDE